MDCDQLRTLKRTVEALTTSGQQTLDEKRLKSLKIICKSSNIYVTELFKILMKYLRRNHAEIRFSAFQICDEIFNRSHCFRELVLKEIKVLCNLVIIYHSDKILKPVSIAKKLRQTAIQCFKQWHEKFKEGYPALRFAYKYLKECENVDFDDLIIATAQERESRESERRREEENRNRKITKVLNEINEKSDEISNTVMEFNNAFKLLIPDLGDFYIPVENQANNTVNTEDQSEDYQEFSSLEYGSNAMREHGLTKETTVDINLANIHTVYETNDNEIILSTLNEKFLNIDKNLVPKVKEWEQSVVQYSALHSELIRNIIDIKRKLESVISCYSSLNIIHKSKQKAVVKSTKNVNDGTMDSSDDDDDDDDFVEVPMNDSRIACAHVLEAELLEGSKVPFKKKLEEYSIKKSDLFAAGSSHQSAMSSTTRDIEKEKLDLSIDNFMNEKWDKPVKLLSNFTGLSNTWAVNESLHDDDQGLKPTDVLGISTRVIDFQRQFKPVQWECRAPLASGRLCPRKDRDCCPLHGPVVPRDEIGKAVRPEDAIRDQDRQDKLERENPDWQNPALLADIKASTGVDLSIKRAKKRKRKYPNLTDIKALDRSPRKRLENKIFSRKSLRRLNKALSKLPS